MDEVEFGRYRLLSVIGEGGMGKVYKAHDTVIGRDVAIKVLSTESAAEPGYRQRFRREAHTAARLTEPHIIPIHDTGEIDGRLYLVMPIIEGVDLHGLLRRDGPMSPQRAVHIVEQLAAALDAAHAVGLVHRDIKPSNALVTGHDFVYLIDFGIAHDATATKLTNTGMLVGTLAYMAPERFTAGVADARSDVYALACVLYECLTGDHPYPGESMEQQIAGHLAVDPPRPSEHRAEVPVGFDEVIAVGLAKDPSQRYQSAHELATAARNALTEVPTPSRNRHTAPAPPDPTQPGPTPLDDQLPPPPPPQPVSQQPARTQQQSPPARPPVPRPRPRPTDWPHSTTKQSRWPRLWRGLIAVILGTVVILAASVIIFQLLQPHRGNDKNPLPPSSSAASPSSAVSSTGSITAPSPSPGQPTDYSSLLIKPSDIGGDFTTPQPPVRNPNNAAGVAQLFANADNSRRIGDTILILADQAATAAGLDNTKTNYAGKVSGTWRPVDVGSNGAMISGTSPDNSQAVTVLLFTEGKALVDMEFDSAPNDPIDRGVATDIGRKQEAAIKNGLPS